MTEDPAVCALRDPEAYRPTARFWEFVAARHALWRARFEGRPAPWTADPILARHRFTNVYRELDRGSVDLDRLVAPLSREDRALTTVAFRMFASPRRWAFGALRCGEYDAGAFVRAFREADALGEHPYGTAYQVSPVACQSREVIEVVAEALAECARLVPGMLYVMDHLSLDHPTAQAAIQDTLPRVGTFLSNQVLLDLTWGPRPVIPLEYGAWAVAGPGALKGLAALGVRRGLATEAMFALRDTQEHAFDRLGLEFVRPTRWDGSRPWLPVSDVEHCLCELQKYLRVEAGGAMRVYP